MCWRNFCNFSLVTKKCESRSKIVLFSNERHFEIWFPKKKTITFFWSKFSKLHKKDTILHVATTFSLKQGETRTSHGPIPHPLKHICFQINCSLLCLYFTLHVYCFSTSVSALSLLGMAYQILGVCLYISGSFLRTTCFTNKQITRRPITCIILLRWPATFLQVSWICSVKSLTKLQSNSVRWLHHNVATLDNSFMAIVAWSKAWFGSGEGSVPFSEK